MAKQTVTLHTVGERLVRIETLLDNHLKHHTMWFSAVIAPTAIGVLAMVVKTFFFAGH